MAEQSTSAQVSHLLHEVGEVLLDERTLDDVLDLVASIARRALPSVDSVRITLERDGRVFTSHATPGVAEVVDQAQYDGRGGPCVDASESNQIALTALADEAAVLCAPLVAGTRSVGTISFYADDRTTFGADDIETVEVLARHASVVLANAMAFAGAGRLIDQLHEAVASRDLIGQAKGILMARENCDAERAFDILRRASQRTNRKLRDVAQELVDSTTDRTTQRARDEGWLARSRSGEPLT